MQDSDASRLKSLDRALDLIETLAGHPHGVSLTIAAKQLGIPKSGAFRVLNTLEQRGYVVQDPRTEHYALGPRFLYLALAVERGSDVRSVATPFLRALRDELNETVYLAVPANRMMAYIDKFPSTRSLQMSAQVGEHAMLHCTAQGKAYLAALDVAQRKQIAESLDYVRRTERTIQTPDELLAELERVARRGYAVNDIENEPEVRCVGAAVRDRSGAPVAGVSVSGAAANMNRQRVALVGKRCREVAEEISSALGGGRALG
ncbi:IclR family transcriptional regulator [Asanoa sp. NPDC050611]|uniref:IclR family transcriptional regulator n=1 Tax=Asanoa sp. NPDC050611 TaxID=3157098 RepID=UPI00340B661D